jgi:hypothetical protein
MLPLAASGENQFGRKIRIVGFDREAVGFSYYDDECHTRNGRFGIHAGHSSKSSRNC